MVRNAAAGPDDLAHSTPHFLTEQETAELLKVSVRSLQRWRQEGGHIRFRRFGGRVRYALADVLAWADAQGAGSTSELRR